MVLYIAGAGGLGRETLDAALAADVPTVGFVDDQLAGGTCRGLPVVALDEVPAGACFAVGIGDADARRALAERLASRGLIPLTIVHPRAVVGPETVLGAGTVVLANAHVSSSVRVGDHVHITYNATIGHDAVLEPFVTVLPGANVAGAVILETGATVGSNACVLQGRRVGAGATVGAGAVVTVDVAPGTVVVGVPARIRHPDGP